MILKKLTLKNFKGINNFELDTSGKDVDIYGDNSTGKSTIFDSVTWLLFNKDSLNSANFDIKTLKPNGQPIHKLEHMVEGVFDFDGTEMVLRKIYYEKYTKRRGKANSEFTGHNTDHFIDGVPVTMTEYKKQIQDICDETLFKLLSNPRYFNEILHWQDRRNMLLEVCGDITDEDVIGSNDELENLPVILKKRKLEDHRKVIASRRAEINKELDKIPVRIDEISTSAVKARNKSEVEKDLSEALEEKKTAEEVLKEIKAGGESEILTTKLRKIENKISKINNALADERTRANEKKASERLKLKNEFDNIQSDINQNHNDFKSLVSDKDETIKNIESFSKQADKLRQRWHNENDKQFECKDLTACPSCGQDLPKDKIKAAREKALETFNALKATALESINNEGKKTVEQIELSKKRLKELEEKIKNSEKRALILNDQKKNAEAALNAFDEQAEVKEPENHERIALLKEKEETQKQIDDKRHSVDPEAILEGETQIATIKLRIESYEKELLQIEANKRIEVRVKELSDQERSLSAEFEELERQLYLTDQFIRTKVNMLEEKINNRFKLASFKLFDEQINQGLSETCVVTFNGVPYPSMNNAARINIGLDICNTLSEHFGKEIPIWIDNKEAVSELLHTKSQQIRLIVSAKDKKLRIEGGI